MEHYITDTDISTILKPFSGEQVLPELPFIRWSLCNMHSQQSLPNRDPRLFTTIFSSPCRHLAVAARLTAAISFHLILFSITVRLVDDSCAKCCKLWGFAVFQAHLWKWQELLRDPVDPRCFQREVKNSLAITLTVVITEVLKEPSAKRNIIKICR